MAPGDPGLDSRGGDAQELGGLSQVPAPEPGKGAIVHASPESKGEALAAAGARDSWASRFQEAATGSGSPRAQQATILAGRVGGQRDMFAILGERPPPRNNHGPILGGPWGCLARRAKALNNSLGPCSDKAGESRTRNIVDNVPRYRAAAASSNRLALTRPFPIAPVTSPAVTVSTEGVVLAGGQGDLVFLRTSTRAQDKLAPRPRANCRGAATAALQLGEGGDRAMPRRNRASLPKEVVASLGGTGRAAGAWPAPVLKFSLPEGARLTDAGTLAPPPEPPGGTGG